MHAKSNESKRRLLVTTSTFPRWHNDTDPPFVYELCRRAASRFAVQVICPHTSGSQRLEYLSGIETIRFRYCFSPLEQLAYEGGILNRIRQHPLRCMLVPLFLAGELYATANILQNRQIECINAHWMIPQGLTAVWAAKIINARCPVICTLHGGDIFSLKGALLNRVKRYILKRSSAVITVSTAMKKAVEKLGIDTQKIHVIPMGVDLKHRFVPLPQSRKMKSILFVGRFVEKKGIRYLIEAFPFVAKKHPDAELTLIGTGPLDTDIKRRVKQYGIQSNIRFMGPVQNAELPAFYQKADIVVFPSIVDKSGDTEGFGLVMVEALGCGCAVVASDLPAISDICIHNRTGLVAEQKNPEMIADRIIELLEKPDKCRMLADAGRQHVLERYDWDVVSGRYCELISNVIEENT